LLSEEKLEQIIRKVLREENSTSRFSATNFPSLEEFTFRKLLIAIVDSTAYILFGILLAIISPYIIALTIKPCIS
jgi:hypothetical protein